MIIRALPSSGKTYSVKRRDDAIDTDDLLRELFGDINADVVNKVFNDESSGEQFKASLDTAIAEEKHVFTNLNTSHFGHPPDIVVGYKATDYVDHIKIAGRQDLLDGFGEEVLTGWALDLEGEQNSVFLKPGHYLAELVELLRL